MRTLQGVPGMLPGRRPEALRVEETEPPELWRDCLWFGEGDADGARVLRIGELDMLRWRAPEDGARGGRVARSDCGMGGGGGRYVWALRVRSLTVPPLD